MFDLPKITPSWTPTEAEYRADPALNFHTLAAFHRDPKAWRDGYFDKVEETDAMRFGTALHAKILEPTTYDDKVAVFAPPVNPKTGECYGSTTNAYKDAAATFAASNAGKTIISAADADLIDALVDAVNFHPVAPSVLGRDFRLTELSVKGVLTVNDVPVEIKGRIDAYTDAGLVDLKTTQTLADASGRDRFRYTVYDYHYLSQLAFYRLLLTEFCDVPATVPCWLIALEKSDPRRVGVYRVDPAVMDKASRVVWSWLTEFVTSQQTNVYASRYDDVQLIDRYDAERDL